MHLDLEEHELKLLDIDERYGKRVGRYTIIGMVPPNKGQTKIYIIQCSECAQDPYLYGLGIFTATYYAIVNNNPCACGIRFKCPEEIQYKKIKRICDEAGFKFNGFVGEYKDVSSTKCSVTCPSHGEMRNSTVKEILAINRPACFSCYSERRLEIFTRKDGRYVDKFWQSGGFHENTIFYRSDRVNEKGHRQFWFMLCGECGTLGESYTNMLTQGYRSCSCASNRQRQAYINLIYKEDDTPIALKFGVANSSAVRVEQQNTRNNLISKQCEVYEFETKIACLAAEREVKSKVETKVLSKDEFSDGYTETCNLKYFIEIQNIYKKHGGVSIIHIETEVYREACVAFVEEFLLGVDHTKESSPYFRTKEYVKEVIND